MNTYKELKERHQKEVNALPFAFAFSDSQFEEDMKKLGLMPDDVDKIYKFGDTGGFYRREDSALIWETFDRHEKEMADAIAGDLTGDGFVLDMFLYELRNHEFGYTRDFESTLDALCMSPEDFEKDERLRKAMAKAAKIVKEEYDANN